MSFPFTGRLWLDELRRVADDARHRLLAEELEHLLDAELLLVAGLRRPRAAPAVRSSMTDLMRRISSSNCAMRFSDSSSTFCVSAAPARM